MSVQRSQTEQQIKRKQMMQEIKQAFQDFSRNEQYQVDSPVDPGFQRIFDDLKARTLARKKDLERMLVHMSMADEGEKVEANQVTSRVALVDKAHESKQIEIASQLEVQKQLEAQLIMLKQQVNIRKSQNNPLYDAEKHIQKNLFLSRDHFNVIQDMDVYLNQYVALKSKQTLKVRFRNQSSTEQTKREKIEHRQGVKNNLKEELASLMINIQQKKAIIEKQKLKIQQLDQEQQIKRKKLEEKKFILFQGYTLVKAKDLCQHPQLFEEYFEQVEVVEDFSQRDDSNNETNISDEMDFQQLFATAIRVRRTNRKESTILKPQVTYQLRFLFDDDEEIRRISEQYFHVEDEVADDLVDELISWFQQELAGLRGVVKSYVTTNAQKNELKQELAIIEEELEEVQQKVQKAELVQSLFEPNVEFDNFNNTNMTLNIKSTSVETQLLIQRMEEKVQQSESIFFELKTFLDVMLYKMFHMLNFMDHNSRIGLSLKQYIEDLSIEKIVQRHKSEIKENLIFKQIIKNPIFTNQEAHQITNQILKENLLRYFLNEKILLIFLHQLQRIETLEEKDFMFQKAYTNMKDKCFILLKQDIQHEFEQFQQLYDLIVKEQMHLFNDATKPEPKVFKVGESLVPSPSKFVQKQYQLSAKKFKKYYDTKNIPQAHRSKWRISDLNEDTPWVVLLRNNPILFGATAVDIPNNQQNKPHDEVGELYQKMRKGSISQDSMQNQFKLMSKTSTNVFQRLHKNEMDFSTKTYKEISQQRDQIHKLAAGTSRSKLQEGYKETKPFRKLQSFLQNEGRSSQTNTDFHSSQQKQRGTISSSHSLSQVKFPPSKKQLSPLNSRLSKAGASIEAISLEMNKQSANSNTMIRIYNRDSTIDKSGNLVK